MSIQSFFEFLAAIDLTKTELEKEINNAKKRAEVHEKLINAAIQHGNNPDTLSMKFHRQGVIETKILHILIEYIDEEAKADLDTTDKVLESDHSNKIHQPVPEQTEDVKVVVEENFNEIVNDNTKDVLIEFYAPYDGRCISFAPKYDELAKKLKKESDIVIAKMDVTKNEVPKQYDVPKQYEVPGLPTIYFAPKNSKNNPRKYAGARVVDELIDYLAKEATEPLNGYDRDGLNNDERSTDDEL